MKTIKIFIIAFGVLFYSNSIAQEKKFKIHTIAFYNAENLFDTINNVENYDEEYTPQKGWTFKKYKQKLINLGKVLSEIGTSNQQKEPPSIIGLCEIENRNVLEDLIKNQQLVYLDYGIVHFDSPDRRGIDVAFLYRKKYFKPTSYINVPLIIYTNEGRDKKIKKEAIEEDTDDKIEITPISKRVYTRDQLLVTGLLDGEEINIIVNHWPSRSGGEKRSSPYREAAGRLNRKIMDSIYKTNPNAKIITMGDLNDGAYNKSIKEGVGAKAKKSELQQFWVYNPFEQMAKDGNATLFHRDAGDIFDQIMVSETLIQPGFSTYKYWKAGIYNKSYLIQTEGQYKGYPKRTTPLEVGFSDHFPVYIYLLKEAK
jgi:hypothetical protein